MYEQIFMNNKGKKKTNSTSQALCLLPYLPLWKTYGLEGCGVCSLSAKYGR